MITDTESRSTPVSPDHAIDQHQHPFYLLADGVPLPLAIKERNEDACKWRDEWEGKAIRNEKHMYLFHPGLRNWVGGAEDGINAVREAREAWDCQIDRDEDGRPWAKLDGADRKGTIYRVELAIDSICFDRDDKPFIELCQRHNSGVEVIRVYLNPDQTM